MDLNSIRHWIGPKNVRLRIFIQFDKKEDYEEDAVIAALVYRADSKFGPISVLKI